MSFGHYYAYAKHSELNKWFCYNDSSVKEIEEDEVVTSSAYVLFYQLRDFPVHSYDALKLKPTLEELTSSKILEGHSEPAKIELPVNATPADEILEETKEVLADLAD